MHLFTYAVIQSITQSLNRSITQSLFKSVTQAVTYSVTHSITMSRMRPFFYFDLIPNNTDLYRNFYVMAIICLSS